jgi:hypothetical protein
MKSEELRKLQASLKEKYHAHPNVNANINKSAILPNL